MKRLIIFCFLIYIIFLRHIRVEKIKPNYMAFVSLCVCVCVLFTNTVCAFFIEYWQFFLFVLH